MWQVRSRFWPSMRSRHRCCWSGWSERRWRCYGGSAPKVALATCVVCGLFLLDALIGTAISVALPSLLIEQGRSSAQIGTAFGLIGIVRSLLHAALWAAVLFAIFSGRAAASAKQ